MWFIIRCLKAKKAIQQNTYPDNSLSWLTQHLYQIIYIFWQVCCVIPARATKSRMAQVKSAAENNDCFEQMARKVWTYDIFFAWTAQAIQTNAQCFQAANAWHVNGKP